MLYEILLNYIGNFTLIKVKRFKYIFEMTR